MYDGRSEAATLNLLLPRYHAGWLLSEVLQLSLVRLFDQAAVLLLRIHMVEIVHALFLFLLDIDETILGLREFIRDAQDFA